RQARDPVLLHVRVDLSVDQGEVRVLHRLALPDRRVAGLAADAVAADPLEPVALVDEVVELALVLGRAEPVPRHPRRPRGLLPDCRVPRVAVDRVAADVDEPEALPDKAPELGLILSRGQSVASDSRRPCRLVPDRRVEILIADVVPADLDEPVPARAERVERALVLSRGHSVPSDPCTGHA